MIKNFLIALKPEQVFVTLAAVFGILYLFLTPPFQSPDENRHFYRAYHMSQGSILATKMDGRVGGYLPKKVKESLIPFSGMRGRVQVVTSSDEIMSSIAYKGDETMEFVDFPSMAVYTPVSYIPQAIGIRLARIFSDSSIIALYAGRLMTLICWMIALFYAIRITPIFKWLIVVLALLPMSLFIHSSLTADMATNVVVFLLLAFILKNTFSDHQQTRKEFLTLVLLVFLLASVKFLYSPVLLLFLIIPLKNFTGKKQFFLRFFGLGLVALITTACWPLILGVGYVSYADYNPDYAETVNLLACANVKEQLTYILSHGIYVFKVISSSIIDSSRMYIVGTIGNFGWLEVPLSSFWVGFGYLGLLLIALTDGNSRYQLKRVQRLIIIAPFLLIFVLIIVSQLLIWTCVGSDLVGNLQGRYFIPIVPLLFLMFYRSNEKFKQYLPVGVVVFSSTLLIVSSLLIYKRFYIPLQYEAQIIRCDHETGGGDADFGTSNDQVLAQNGASRSEEEARSGKYSSRLIPTSQYGTIIKLDDCSSGDIIEFDAWRLGPSGLLVISTEDAKQLYFTTDQVEKESEGWQKMNLTVTVPLGIENDVVSCYVGSLHPTDTCYFDDIKLTLNRIK